uniref:Uncharacterized protein n=1 Tax=viral metagenome TaxID=1070528 RepID=A0A6C0IW92_9ZZZZ
MQIIFWICYYVKCFINMVYALTKTLYNRYILHSKNYVKKFLSHNKTKYKPKIKINDYLYLIKLSGNYYSMGKQYGIKTKTIIKRDKEIMTNFIIKNQTIFNKKIPKKYRENNIFISLKKYAKDLVKYMNKDILEFTKGVAYSTNIDYNELIYINLFTDITDNHCILLSKKINGKTFNMRTLDFGIPLLTHCLTVFKPKNKKPYINLAPSIFFGCCTGVSETIFFGESFYDIALDNQISINGMPYHHFSHLILSECETIDDANKLLSNLDRKSNLQLLISDRQKSKMYLSSKNKFLVQQDSDKQDIIFSVTPNEKSNFNKNFHYLDSIQNIIDFFIPNTKSGELHIMMNYGDNLYISVTTKFFQSYNNNFYKFSIKKLIK